MKRGIKAREVLQAFVAITLAVVYCFSVFSGHVHVADEHHFHSDATETCSAERSEDPCHQAIYHHVEKVCSHDVHLYAPVESCDMCDVLISPVRQTSGMDGIAGSTPLYSRIICTPAKVYVPLTVTEIQLRGPPSHIV